MAQADSATAAALESRIVLIMGIFPPLVFVVFDESDLDHSRGRFPARIRAISGKLRREPANFGRDCMNEA
jgi:hypothetical protein